MLCNSLCAIFAVTFSKNASLVTILRQFINQGYQSGHADMISTKRLLINLSSVKSLWRLAKTLKKMILAMIHDQYMFFSTERIVNKMVVLDLIFTPTHHFHFTCIAYVDITLNWLHNTITNKFLKLISTGAGNKALSFFQDKPHEMVETNFLIHGCNWDVVLSNLISITFAELIWSGMHEKNPTICVGQYHRLFLSW